MRFVPTRRLVVAAGLALALGTVAGFVPAARAPALALDGLLVVLALLDAATVRAPALRVTRRAPAIFSIGRENVVAIEVASGSARAIDATVADDPIEASRSEGLPARLHVPPHGTQTVRYRVLPERRGPRRFGAVTVRVSGLLGLVMGQERRELPADMAVYPDVQAARVLELLRRQGRRDARLGALRARGGDTEFERLRPYQPGDEVRRIDQRASARRDEPVVRQLQADSNQTVMFLLDTGRALRQQSGEVELLDRALNAVALAADVATRGGDKAGLLAFDEAPRRFVKPQGGRSGSRAIVLASYDLDATLAASSYARAAAFFRARVKARSLVVLLTSVLDPRSASDLARAVGALLPVHLPLCVLLRDEAVERLLHEEAPRDDDLYLYGAAAEALTWRDDLKRRLEHEGAMVVDARPEDVTLELVRRYMEIKARRLL